MNTIIWEHFQKCDVCDAELGKPCMQLTGFNDGPLAVEADAPHGGRKLRAGYGR